MVLEFAERTIFSKAWVEFMSTKGGKRGKPAAPAPGLNEPKPKLENSEVWPSAAAVNMCLRSAVASVESLVLAELRFSWQEFKPDGGEFLPEARGETSPAKGDEEPLNANRGSTKLPPRPFF